MNEKNITIVGAGLVGTLLSIYLSRRGHRVTVYERRPDMRKEKIAAGRSINLALSDRGLMALDKLGLSAEIKSIAIPMHGRRIHHADGSTGFQPYGKQGQFINSVSRAALNQKLIEIAEKSGVKIIFNQKLAGIDWSREVISFQNESGKEFPNAKCDVIFGADGAFSTARLQHQLQHDRFEYNQSFIDCGYKELTIPPTAGGEFAFEHNALHIWPRKNFMLIALPNLDKSFTCTLFFPFDGDVSFSSLKTKDSVVDFFKNNFPDVVRHMPNYADEFFANPVSSLVTVKCFPWVREDKFALIGDAAHAIVPFFGQGMNCGFEDCRILDELMDKYGDDWKGLLTAYQEKRKEDTDAIAELAVTNFIEMRERTADPKFLLQKKIEAQLHEKYPDQWIPAYAQVTFNPNIRYSEALKKGNQQEEIMQEVMSDPHIENSWNDDDLHQRIIQKLNEQK